MVYDSPHRKNQRTTQIFKILSIFLNGIIINRNKADEGSLNWLKVKYTESLPIEKTKLKTLLKLCSSLVIPSIYRNF